MFSIKSLTEKNKGRKNKPNQDHFSSWFKDGLNNPHGFLGVYDGHGNYGHYVSEIIRDYFALNIPEQWEELNNDFYTTINTFASSKVAKVNNDEFSSLEKTGSPPEKFEKIRVAMRLVTEIFENIFLGLLWPDGISEKKSNCRCVHASRASKLHRFHTQVNQDKLGNSKVLFQ